MQTNLHLSVYFDPAVITVGPAPVRSDFANDAEYTNASLKWQREVALLNWNKIIEASLRAAAPAGYEIDARELLTVAETNARHQVREMFLANPALFGQTAEVEVLASANADNWVKGNINRSLGDAQQQLSAPARTLIDQFVANDTITSGFNWSIFTNVDSRAAPASAGLLGALVGSLYMMLIVIVLAVPIGVASAVYLESSRPNRADRLHRGQHQQPRRGAVHRLRPARAAVFINYLHLPLSAPLVGGLVLTLMTPSHHHHRHPWRAARRIAGAAPGRPGHGRQQDADGVHHVLPVTFPSILTATIIGCRARDRRNRTAAADRHEGVRRRRARHAARPGDRASGADLPLAGQ